jgi:hypothetical protein
MLIGGNDELKTDSSMDDLDIRSNKEIHLIDKTEFKQFYIYSYKCNNGNYLKSFIYKIKEISESYPDLTINFETNNVKDLFVKILLSKIELINHSFVPAITNNDIIQTIESVNKDFSIIKINTILNRYNSQLNYFSIIYSIINYDTVDKNPEILFDLINENTNNYDYIELNLPFTKQQLLEKIINNQEQQPNTALSSVIQPSEEIIPQQADKSSNIESDVSKMDFSNLLKQHGILPDKSSNKKQIKPSKRSNFPILPETQKDNYGQMRNYSDQTASVFGGTIKHRRKQIHKTKNNKRKNKRGTINKRKVRVRRFTIKR